MILYEFSARCEVLNCTTRQSFDWLKEQTALATRQQVSLKEGELKQQCSEFMRLLRKGTQGKNPDISTEEWTEMRELLTSVSRSRAQQGFTPSQTATFVFSFKRPLFIRLRKESKTIEIFKESRLKVSKLLGLDGTAVVVTQRKEDVIFFHRRSLPQSPAGCLLC